MRVRHKKYWEIVYYTFISVHSRKLFFWFSGLSYELIWMIVYKKHFFPLSKGELGSVTLSYIKDNIIHRFFFGCIIVYGQKGVLPAEERLMSKGRIDNNGDVESDPRALSQSWRHRRSAILQSDVHKNIKKKKQKMRPQRMTSFVSRLRSFQCT